MHASRRQKKARTRPFSPPVAAHQAYKIAKLVRGQQGFGFTISGQAPCILSCVVPHSSADRAGLHAGDCLLAVNGCDVSRAPHDEVVRLVGSCTGTLRLHLAESGLQHTTAAQGYSSSDEESDEKPKMLTRSRPPRTRHTNRLKRHGATPPNRAERVVRDVQSGYLGMAMASNPSGTKHRRRKENSSSSSQEQISNLVSSTSLHMRMNKPNNAATNNAGQLLYRSVVGYLGTIEMPEDSNCQSQANNGISSASASGNNSAAARLAAIRSCVRRLRVEKKVHTLVLLRVWGPRPGASEVSTSGKITLTSPAGANLARFPARRVVFCGAYADDARFFGLVTSASNASDSDSGSDSDEKVAKPRQNLAGFTSCHVFMVDSRLVPHEGHAARAHAFRFQCTAVASAEGRCLEFPPTAEPILQAVLSLCTSTCSGNNPIGSGLMGWANPLQQQQQQQPQQQQHNLSSHSSSSSSNSDSGIFRDRDEGKNSDRDVQLRHPPFHNNENLDRLTVRAMPDAFAGASVKQSPGEVEHAIRLRSSMQRFLVQPPQLPGMLLNRNTGTHQHVNPSLLSVRATMTLEEKLSPQVYKARPVLPQPIKTATTPSERNRARSLDDLSKSSHLPEQQLGSDNGLDKLDWSAPFKPVAPQSHWRSMAGESSSSIFSTKTEKLDHDESEVHTGHREENGRADLGASQEIYEKDQPENSQQQHIWAQGFEKLLEDPLGLRAFAGFLKKEFSHENIYFWAACERFRRLFPNDDPSIASSEARKIFGRHLGPAAPEPVNVDSQARQVAEENLSQAGPDLFDQAQKQVFNLMKYDCYPRFLRSPIYRQCMQAIQDQQPLPISEQTLNDPDLNIDYDFSDGDDSSLSRNSKLKKSESDAGERRRRSLLPWPRKDRSKSKDRGEADYRKTGKKKNRIGSTSSGSGDKEKENTDDEELLMKRAASKDSVASEFSDRAFNIQNTSSTVPLVKVLLPDLSSAVIAARSGQTVQQLLQKLVERRGLGFTAFELFSGQSSTSIDLEQDASSLAGMEVRLEPRVVFQLLLLSGKSLLIRGQPQRQLVEVLKPILTKYGIKIENVSILKNATNETVPLKTLMASLDGLHLKVVKDRSFDDTDETGCSVEDRSATEEQDQQAPLKSASHLLGRKSLARRNSLHNDRNKSSTTKKSNQANESGTQNSTTTVGHKRLSLHDLHKSTNLSSPSQLMPPPRAPFGPKKATGQRNPLSRLENEALYERLKRAQRSRLEDQRGTEINFEMPDFLKLPRCSTGDYTDSLELPIDGRASEPIFGCRPRNVYQESSELPLDGRVSEPIFLRRNVVSDPRGNASAGVYGSPDFAAIAAQILDKSFSTDGLVPTHEQAENFFGAPPPSSSADLKAERDQPTPKITVAAAKQNVATVAARIAAIEHKEKASENNNRGSTVKLNSNWDDLLLDLDVDWRCYQGRETDDQKQQQLQQHWPRVRPPLPNPPALELLDLDDPLIATPAPPPLPPKPGKVKGTAAQFRGPMLQIQPLPPPRPPSRNINASRVNVSFV